MLSCRDDVVPCRTIADNHSVTWSYYVARGSLVNDCFTSPPICKVTKILRRLNTKQAVFLYILQTISRASSRKSRSSRQDTQTSSKNVGQSSDSESDIEDIRGKENRSDFDLLSTDIIDDKGWDTDLENEGNLGALFNLTVLVCFWPHRLARCIYGRIDDDVSIPLCVINSFGN